MTTLRKIPTYGEYEEKCGHPVTEGEYTQYLKLNYKDELEELDRSEDLY